MTEDAVHHDRTVRRRAVFFLPGYDPNPPRRYRELYRREGARQAAISGYALAIEGVPGTGVYRWRVRARMDGVETETLISFLTWEDLVRGSMDRSVLASLTEALRTAWIYLSSGAFRRLVRLRPQPMIAALYPIWMLVLQLAVAWLVFRLGTGLAALVPGWVAGALAVVGFLGTMALFRRFDRHLFVYYLIHDYAFTSGGRGRYPPALARRIEAFAEAIAAAAREDVDEVLVVGHSSGAQLAVSALAGALDRIPDGGPVLSLLTLGQVIPMMSFLPEAARLRRDLNRLSASGRIAWVDVSAPGDGGCFALCDPVHVSGVAPPEAEKRWPKVISAAFTETLAPETLAKTKWRFFRRHIQYLCAFERPGAYDYFAITAGPRTLEDRFAWRGATASRVETPLSPWRDMA